MYVCGNGPINAAITTTAIARSKRKRKFERFSHIAAEFE
jgi:hypothetical protein